jgi:hypothetical protein
VSCSLCKHGSRVRRLRLSVGTRQCHDPPAGSTTGLYLRSTACVCRHKHQLIRHFLRHEHLAEADVTDRRLVCLTFKRMMLCWHTSAYNRTHSRGSHYTFSAWGGYCAAMSASSSRHGWSDHCSYYARQSHHICRADQPRGWNPARNSILPFWVTQASQPIGDSATT